MKGVIPSDVKYLQSAKKMLGLGHAISCAEHLLREEPFAVLLPDEYLLPDKDFLDLREMVKISILWIGQILVEKIGPRKFQILE